MAYAPRREADKYGLTCQTFPHDGSSHHHAKVPSTLLTLYSSVHVEFRFLRLTQGTQVLAQALTRSTRVVAARTRRGLYCICRDSEILYCRSPRPLTEQGPTPSTLFLVPHWQMLSSQVWQGRSTRQRRARWYELSR